MRAAMASQVTGGQFIQNEWNVPEPTLRFELYCFCGCEQQRRNRSASCSSGGLGPMFAPVSGLSRCCFMPSSDRCNSRWPI